MDFKILFNFWNIGTDRLSFFITLHWLVCFTISSVISSDQNCENILHGHKLLKSSGDKLKASTTYWLVNVGGCICCQQHFCFRNYSSRAMSSFKSERYSDSVSEESISLPAIQGFPSSCLHFFHWFQALNVHV